MILFFRRLTFVQLALLGAYLLLNIFVNFFHVQYLRAWAFIFPLLDIQCVVI